MTSKRTKISFLNNDSIGSSICVKGWVRTIRQSKNVSFISLNDGSTINSLQEIFLIDGLKNNSRRGINKKASKIGAYVKIPVELNETYAKNGIERVRKYFKNLNFIFIKIKQIYERER